MSSDALECWILGLWHISSNEFDICSPDELVGVWLGRCAPAKMKTVIYAFSEQN